MDEPAKYTELRKGAVEVDGRPIGQDANFRNVTVYARSVGFFLDPRSGENSIDLVLCRGLLLARTDPTLR